MKPWEPSEQEVEAKIQEMIAPHIEEGERPDSSYRDAHLAADMRKRTPGSNILFHAFRGAAMWSLYKERCWQQQQEILRLKKEIAQLRK